MLERNKVLKDVKLSRFIYMVNKLTVPEVKTKILELYLEKCKLIGFIAFSQWRYIHSIIAPGKFKKLNISQLEDQIYSLNKRTKGLMNTAEYRRCKCHQKNYELHLSIETMVG